MKRYKGPLTAKQTFNGTWIVECHEGKGRIRTIKTGLTEYVAKEMVENA